MPLGASETLTLVIAGGGLFIGALTIASGAGVLSSARSANRHISSGIALTVRAPAAVAPVSAPGATFGGPVRGIIGFLGPRGADVPPTSGAPGAANVSGDASQQIFALLGEYYAANISQGNAVFWACLLSMSIGFAIIFAGIVIAAANATAASGATAIVTAIAGILTQFIGATFLVALRSTQQQATSYAQSLVELRLHDVRAAADAQSVTLGLRLLEELTAGGANELTDQTRATLAMGLILKDAPAAVPTAPPTSVPDDDEAHHPDPQLGRTSRVSTVSSDTTVPPNRPRTTER